MKLQGSETRISSIAAAFVLITGSTAFAADTATATVPVTMTVTANIAGNKLMPEMGLNDIVVRQGKSRLEVTGWVPARADRAGLELFILIDDGIDPAFSMQYNELRAFINRQPQSTSIGVAYMRNGTIQIAQSLTTDHASAAKALRIPFGRGAAYESPYLSLEDLMKSWPVDKNRREVIMITSGIGRDQYHHGSHSGYRTDADVDRASTVAQKTGTNVFTIYAPARGRVSKSRWTPINGQMNMTRLSDSTGGASFYLGVNGPVTILPYLTQVQSMLDNQYLLSFAAKADKESGLWPISISTEMTGVKLTTDDAVWVPRGQ